MLQFWRNVWVNPIEKILKLLPRVDVGYVSQNFHLFFELVLQKSVVNPDNSFDIDASDDVFHEIFRMEPGFDEVDTTHKPLFCCFAFLEPNVSSRLELSHQFPYWYFVDLS